MKTWQWVIVVAPLMVTSGAVLQGCTLDMCPTEEEKAAAKANGTELVESDDCLGDEQKENPCNRQDGGGGASQQSEQCLIKPTMGGGSAVVQ